MNTENLNHLIDNYLNVFDTINNDVHQEYYKWEAVKHFQDHWDIDAEDFAGMFKEAVKASSNLINNRMVQPTNGIIKLAENPDLTDTVREMFRDLFEEDGGDINDRQERIHAFMDKADELLNTYEKGKWKYAQDLRTVIMYLNLMHPDKNYMFKATQAREFMYCVEFADDFGSGDNFKLEKYYRMCDELVEEIKKNEYLMQTHHARMTSSMYAEDNYHILAYDIIYSAIVYDLYKDINVVRPKGASSTEKTRIIKINELNAKLAEANHSLNQKLQERSEFDDVSAKGLIVIHKTFGEGTVIDQQDCRIVVRFVSGEKKFQLPQGFANGFLKTESNEIMDIFASMAILDHDIKTLRSTINSITLEMTRIN